MFSRDQFQMHLSSNLLFIICIILLLNWYYGLQERPRWMKISSLDELKTKVGHVIVMILLVKMFERSKMVTIATGMDLLSYSVSIFLSSASLYILHNLQKSEKQSAPESS